MRRKDRGGGVSFRLENIGRFLNQLGSDSGSPGGGSAAALTAALGIALAEMVVRINVKGKPAGRKSKAARLKALRQRMELVMDKDAAAFSALSRFYKTKDRGARYQAALKKAAEVPFVICETVPEALRLAESEAASTGRWLMSDLVESKTLLKAAFDAGKLNVEINLNALADKRVAAAAKKRLAALEKTL